MRHWQQILGLAQLGYQVTAAACRAPQWRALGVRLPLAIWTCVVL